MMFPWNHAVITTSRNLATWARPRTPSFDFCMGTTTSAEYPADLRNNQSLLRLYILDAPRPLSLPWVLGHHHRRACRSRERRRPRGLAGVTRAEGEPESWSPLSRAFGVAAPGRSARLTSPHGRPASRRGRCCAQSDLVRSYAISSPMFLRSFSIGPPRRARGLS
jgi:hypothetical protein